MRTIRNDKETKRLDIETIVEKRTFVQNELGLLVSGKSYALPLVDLIQDLSRKLRQNGRGGDLEGQRTIHSGPSLI